MDWYRMGTVASIIANTAANRKPNSKTFKPGDFIPKTRQQGRTTTKQFRSQLFAAFGDRMKKNAD